MSDDTELLRARWAGFCERLGCANADPLYLIIESLYAHPPRAYHNLKHIAACLKLLDECGGPSDATVELALWLHDAVYDPRRSDNEAISAQVAAVFARELSLSASSSDLLRSLILATRHDSESLAGAPALVADIDMAILGSPPEQYAVYAAAIREEYSFVPDPDYHRGRSDFLRKLLNRQQLFHTDNFAAAFTTRSKRNIEKEL